MKRKIITFLLILVPFIFWGAAPEFSVDQANRVDLALKQIAKKKRVTPFLRKISFSQDELNSYLNIIYAKHYAPEVKYINLKLNKNNSVDGVMNIKLNSKEYEKVPEFLRNIEVDFCGKIECENSRMRYLFETLKINGTNFSPELLDQAYGAAQGEAAIKKSLFDWFELFPGLKKMAVEYKEIIIYY